jgi:hypothetical protein
MDDGPQVCSFDYKLTKPTLDDTPPPPKTFSVCKINEIMDTFVIKVAIMKNVIAKVMELG